MARLETGHTPSRKKPEYWEGAIPWIGIKDATGNHGRRISDTAQYTNDLGIENSSARVLPANTVCLSRTASVGHVVVMGQPMATSQDFVNWVCTDDLDWRFLKYVLLAEHDSIKRFAHGTTHQTVYFPEVKAFHVLTPPLNEQSRIARVLGALDDKIESNRRIAATLEEIAATLFKARFVDFVGHDEFVESEVGPVPKGWAVESLSEIADVTMGQSPPSSSYSNDPASGPVMVQGKGAFGARYPKPEVYCNAPTRLADPGDLLMTVRAPVGEINICNSRTCLGRGVAGIASRYPGFIEFSLRVGSDRWRARESGTIYPSVNKQQVEEFPVVIPPDALRDEFEQVAKPVRNRIGAIHSENDTLAALRDTLLPKLISGEIRVPAEGFEDAEVA